MSKKEIGRGTGRRRGTRKKGTGDPGGEEWRIGKEETDRNITNEGGLRKRQVGKIRKEEKREIKK